MNLPLINIMSHRLATISLVSGTLPESQVIIVSSMSPVSNHVSMYPSYIHHSSIFTQFHCIMRGLYLSTRCSANLFEPGGIN